MKHLKHIINGAVWTIVGLYVAIIILLHIPAVQSLIGNEVSSALSKKFGTKVTVGSVDLGFINRLIIDNVSMLDQKGKTMFEATRLSVKFDYIPLVKGKIVISSAQIFGLEAVLYKETAQAKPNYQFVLDSLASKDTTSHTPMDLQINSLIIRHGMVKYDILDVVRKYRQFSPQHLDIRDISAHFIINALRDDSANVNIKNLAFNETAGLQVRSLSLRLTANRQAASLSKFVLELPKTKIELGDITATYSFMDGKMEMPSLQYEGSIRQSSITPSDLSCLIPQMKKFVNPINISSVFSGTSTSLRVNDLFISSNNGSIKFRANGSINNWKSTPNWYADITNLSLSAAGIKFISDNLGKKLNLPVVVTRLGDIRYSGTIGGYGLDLSTRGTLHTDVGNAKIAIGKYEEHFSGNIETPGLDLKTILANNDFGNIATHIDIKGNLPSKHHVYIQAKGVVSRFDYKSYTYRNLSVDGAYDNGTLTGSFGMDDTNGKIDIKGHANLTATTPSAKLTMQVYHLNPSALNISNKWPGTLFDFNVSADLSGRNLNTANGQIDLTDFRMKSEKNDYKLSELHISAQNVQNQHTVAMTSDFGHVVVNGHYDYTSIVQSFTNLIGNTLPTFPGLAKYTNSRKNDFTINATIERSDWLQQMLNVPLELHAPMLIDGTINDDDKHVDMNISIPDFSYNNKKYKNGHIRMTSPEDSLKADMHLNLISTDGHILDLNVNAGAANNILNSSVKFFDHGKNNMHGQINAETQFFKTDRGISSAHIKVHPSDIFVGDTIWNVQPSDIIYSKNNLNVDHFAIEHNKQHIIINGLASKSQSDSLLVDLKDVDVSYILNLVDFHAVSFSGLATGRAYIAGAFNAPQASAKLLVNEFEFQHGRMGVLTANVKLNNKEEQLDINAIANDGPGSQTLINGYVSPKRNTIDLGIKAQNTRLEFIESFCSSFMRDVNAYGNGEVRLYGMLNRLNLVGNVVADGTLDISSLNTTYTLKNDTITLIPDEIQLRNDKIYDRNGNEGMVTGSLYHNNLKKLSYKIDVKAKNMLSYDFKELGSNTFYGTICATGDCSISGKSGEVNIDVNAKPEKGSTLVYNVASPETVSSNSFIHWASNNTIAPDTTTNEMDLQNDRHDTGINGIAAPDIPSDIHLNFLINCNQNATLKLLMDNQSGDYITLNGDGVIHATYYNKGAFQMFGNYLVDHGIYKLTIQNVIKKDFQFRDGGTIVFGGDPYDAALNLKAQYIVNGVSLSDLNLGSSFSNNNIRVNCIMNITGTPNSPKVDFNLDMPTVNSDAKQMIYSLINSQEEMNQQVLYLLAIGRFYNQGNNNATAETAAQQSQTSLAMQSILSGTLSQQINNVLSSVINNANWNFGANISTGNEGWNNAEYEGLLSGRLLNNRLLINGQFGYRDNANATTSFIGDFDIRYLLYPNGNLAIKVYNQTNDRYFTRNSLNTQGLGLIMKKDFNSWKDLINSNRKTKKKQKKTSL